MLIFYRRQATNHLQPTSLSLSSSSSRAPAAHGAHGVGRVARGGFGFTGDRSESIAGAASGQSFG